MIVGTAGHIDHGKTTLVQALTGVDTDRLKEEKARGISIELGYAYTPMANGDILGFIDVPGHERLIHTMAAGASGIDFGLLVIAADDGVMPQTREHLAILSLLGLTDGAVALSKADRVEAARLDEVRQEIRALVAGSFLQDMPVFCVSATSPGDAGVDRLRAHLHETAQGLLARGTAGLFRLAIDRAFTLKGHGTVVTGTVHDGVLDLHGDAIDLRLMPSGQTLRVRSIHAQNQASPQARAGQRCALNLGGIDKDAISRGDWVADARCFLPSRNIDVAVRLLPDAGNPIRTWSPLHVHLGAAHFVAHAVPLSSAALGAGESGWVQLVFDQAVCAMVGDRFILRDAQARHTVGGGQVLDPNAPQRKRRSPERLAWLRSVERLLGEQDWPGLLLHAPWGLGEAQVMRFMQRVPMPSLPAGAVWVGAVQARTLILQEKLEGLLERVLQVLQDFHQRWPDEPGIDEARLKRMAMPNAPEALWRALCDHLIESGQAARNGPWLHKAGHAVRLGAEEEALAGQLIPLIRAAGFEPSWVRNLANAVNEPEQQVRQVLLKLLRSGELYQVVKDLFLHREQVVQLAELVDELGTEAGIAAAQFRDRTGLGRKRSIQILEFFDRAGYTRRLRDKHVPRKHGVDFWHRLS